MRDQKAVLRYYLDNGWMVVNQDIFIKLIHENIRDFDILLNDDYQTSKYYFNIYGELCVIVAGQEFSLSKSTGYDIEF
ncbi:MAG: hypothetical protein KGY44_10115 [Halanaerobiales bacterium]|nr:hypothetical protein [Halanaerobiales bacterium]HMA59372.1 hypothetical protein [Halanaerobiales bacterium]